MIGTLKPYSDYKPSTQAWLGEVPKHWPIVPNRAVFDEVKDRDCPDEEMLSVTIANGIVRQKALLEGNSKKDSSNLEKTAYKLVQPHDIAYNKMRAWQGAIGASSLRGIVSPAYVVMRLRNETNLPNYYHHLFRTPQFAKEAERWSYGITSDMWSLRPEHFKMIYAPEPPPAEQAAIVRFLDWANGRLERAIRAKRKVITLLNEQKQAIIHRAVTRGLDPGVALRPSGISWLGDIAHNWEVKKVREIGVVVNGFPFNSRMFTPDRGHSLIRIRDLNKVETAVRYRGDFVDSARIRPGEVLVGMDGDFNVGTWNGADDALLNQRMCCVRTSSPLLDELLLSALSRPLWQINEVTYATTVKHLAASQVERISIAVPPASELKAVVGFVREQREYFEKKVARFEQELKLLREYRTRLVADVVTGKLDVREAAAGLPDEVPLGTVEDVAGLGEDPDITDEEATA